MRFLTALALLLGLSITFAQAEEPVDILYQDAPTTQGQCPAFDQIVIVLQANAQAWDQADPAAPDYSANVAELAGRYSGLISYGDRIAQRAPGTDPYAWVGLRTLLNSQLQTMAIAEAHDPDIDLRESWFVQMTRAHLAAGHFLAGTPNYAQ